VSLNITTEIIMSTKKSLHFGRWIWF